MSYQTDEAAAGALSKEPATTAVAPLAGGRPRSTVGPVLSAALCAAVIVLIAAVAVMLTTASEMREVQRRQSEAARVALSLAVNQLHAVALRNVPFSAELGLVRAISGPDAETARDLAILEPLQHEGLPGMKRIVGDFERIAADVLISERTGPQPGWLNQVVGRMSAVTVALAMEIDWNPLSSATAPPIRAMATALRGGDLAKALREIAALPPSARNEFEPWRDLVQRRIDASAAIERLMARTSSDKVLRSAQAS